MSFKTFDMNIFDKGENNAYERICFKYIIQKCPLFLILQQSIKELENSSSFIDV
jgi:hypothetical protein